MLKDMIQEGIEDGATTAEEIHQRIAALPLETLESLGLFDDQVGKVKDFQSKTIGRIYDAIRTVNSEVGHLISKQFEQLEDAQAVAENLRERDNK